MPTGGGYGLLIRMSETGGKAQEKEETMCTVTLSSASEPGERCPDPDQ